MNKMTQERPPNELYREYQATRDDISPQVFDSLMDSAANRKHEDNIHAILEQAKVAHTTTNQHNNVENINKPKNGLLKSLSQWWNPVWGGAAVATALIAAIAVPLVYEVSPYGSSKGAYLAGCSDCANYAANASALTRSSNLGKPIPVQVRTAAKLGRIQAKFEIAQITQLSALQNSAAKELNTLAERLGSEQLKSLSPTSDLGQAMSGIERYAKSDIEVFNASKALFIANVSARDAKVRLATLALQASNSEAVKELNQRFNLATDSFRATLGDSELRKNVSLQLETAIEQPITAPHLDRIIELTRRAMESLGA